MCSATAAAAAAAALASCRPWTATSCKASSKFFVLAHRTRAKAKTESVVVAVGVWPQLEGLIQSVVKKAQRKKTCVGIDHHVRVRASISSGQKAKGKRQQAGERGKSAERWYALGSFIGTSNCLDLNGLIHHVLRAYASLFAASLPSLCMCLRVRCARVLCKLWMGEGIASDGERRSLSPLFLNQAASETPVGVCHHFHGVRSEGWWVGVGEGRHCRF